MLFSGTPHSIPKLLGLTLLAFALWAPSASAQSTTAVVVIDSGTSDLFIESLVRTNAETELRKRGFTIVEGAEVGGETPSKLLACAGGLECTMETLKGIDAEHVIFLSLRSDGDSESENFKIVIRDYEVATGRVLARSMRRCPECKEEVDLAVFAEQMIVDLLSKGTGPVEPAVVEPAVVEPAVVEPAAIEPAVVEPVPVTGVIPRPTYQPVSHSRDSGSSALTTTLKYIGLGGGMAAMAAGTYLVLIDGPVIDNRMRQPEENDTLALGFVGLGVGAAMIGVSAWLWSLDDEEQETLSRASFVPTRGGGAISWTRGF